MRNNCAALHTQTRNLEPTCKGQVSRSDNREVEAVGWTFLIWVFVRSFRTKPTAMSSHISCRDIEERGPYSLSDVDLDGDGDC